MVEKEPLGTRLKHAWNAFRNRDPTEEFMGYSGVPRSMVRQDRLPVRVTTERSMVSAVYNRIALDVAAAKISHVRQDDNGRFQETINSGLNYCLTSQSNIDQTSKAFIQDVVLSMFDEGSVAIVPVDTTVDPKITGGFDVHSMRTGKILDWYPQHVAVEVYNEQTGMRERIHVPKKMVAIVENPFYMVMNEPNAILKRLIRKMNLLDVVDDQNSSGKLDMIIQLPYVIKTEQRRMEAEKRRKDIEVQLTGSKYGVAYTDGTERITQLNRSVENNLFKQVEYFMNLFFSQLGVSEEIFNGKADEQMLLNYNNAIITPIIDAIIDAIKVSFLTKTARTQGQTIMAFKEPFKLVPVGSLADIADKFTRNAIVTSNEFRSIIGFLPSDDPDADALRNKNLNQSKEEVLPNKESDENSKENQNGSNSD